jgi:hypothetical protein
VSSGDKHWDVKMAEYDRPETPGDKGRWVCECGAEIAADCPWKGLPERCNGRYVPNG